MKKDTNLVPSNYEELYNHYLAGSNSLANQIIRTMLSYSNEDERADLLQAVAVRCIEHDVIAKYDPTKANFGGVIYFVTRTIVSNHLDKKSRNPITGLNGGTLQETNTEDEFEMGTYRLDRTFTVQVDAEGQLADRETVNQLFTFAQNRFRAVAEQAPTTKNKRDRSLLPLLKLMAEGYDPKECAVALDVTVSTVHNWIGELKTAVAA